MRIFVVLARSVLLCSLAMPLSILSAHSAVASESRTARPEGHEHWDAAAVRRIVQDIPTDVDGADMVKGDVMTALDALPAAADAPPSVELVDKLILLARMEARTMPKDTLTRLIGEIQLAHRGLPESVAAGLGPKMLSLAEALLGTKDKSSGTEGGEFHPDSQVFFPIGSVSGYVVHGSMLSRTSMWTGRSFQKMPDTPIPPVIESKDPAIRVRGSVDGFIAHDVTIEGPRNLVLKHLIHLLNHQWLDQRKAARYFDMGRSTLERFLKNFPLAAGHQEVDLSPWKL